MVKLISKIISKIKHREYHIDENIKSGDLMGIVSERGIMLIRGIFCKMRFKKKRKACLYRQACKNKIEKAY